MSSKKINIFIFSLSIGYIYDNGKAKPNQAGIKTFFLGG